MNGVIKATFDPLNINPYNIIYRFIKKYMNLKLLKLIVINIIIVNYFNYALSSELIIPKNVNTEIRYTTQ